MHRLSFLTRDRHWISSLLQLHPNLPGAEVYCRIVAVPDISQLLYRVHCLCFRASECRRAGQHPTWSQMDAGRFCHRYRSVFVRLHDRKQQSWRSSIFMYHWFHWQLRFVLVPSFGAFHMLTMMQSTPSCMPSLLSLSPPLIAGLPPEQQPRFSV